MLASSLPPHTAVLGVGGDRDALLPLEHRVLVSCVGQGEVSRRPRMSLGLFMHHPHHWMA